MSKHMLSMKASLWLILPITLISLLSSVIKGDTLFIGNEMNAYHRWAFDHGLCSQPDPPIKITPVVNIDPGRVVLFFMTAFGLVKTKALFDIQHYDAPASGVDNLIYALVREREKSIILLIDKASSHLDNSEIISSAGHILFGLYFLPAQLDFQTPFEMSTIWSIRAGLARAAQIASNAHTEPAINPNDIKGSVHRHDVLTLIFIFPCSIQNQLHQQPRLKIMAEQACAVGFSLYGKNRLKAMQQPTISQQDPLMACAREMLVIGAGLLYTQEMGPSPSLAAIIGSQLIKQGAGFSLDAFNQQFLSDGSYVKHLLEYSLEATIFLLAAMDSLHSHDVVQRTYISKLRDAAVYYTGIRLIDQASWLINDLLSWCTDFL